MSNLKLKITYLNEIHEILQKHYTRLKKVARPDEYEKNAAKRMADAMMKSARVNFYEVEGEIRNLDKDDSEVKIIKRKIVFIEGYAKKLYQICGHRWG
jgi:hypothetical protein